MGYFFDQGLDLSGLGADQKIAFSGEGKVCFTGAKTIPHKSFKKLTDPELIERLISEAAKQNIVVVNLKQLGINDFGTIQRHGWCLESEHRTPPVFLSHGGQTLNLARWPNKDEASEYLCDRAKAVHIKGMVSYTSVVNKGASWDRSKTWHKDPDFMQGGGSFIVGFDRMKHWRDPQNIWIDGILSATWEWTYNHIKSIDVEKGQINLVHGELNGLGTKAKAPHFYFENIFEEIDQAGEYFLDRERGLLYLYPPANFEEEPLRLTTLNEALLSLKHAKNLSFENIIFDSGRHYAVEMKQCENVVFENCKIKNFVKGGVVIDGRLNKIKNCEINGIGAFGVSLSGGNTKTLEAGGNEVVGCKIWYIGWDQKSQMPGVIFDRKSVGNRVANCEIFETPHFAIRIPGGNDNIVENNYLHDLPYYHHFDGGAIYVATGRQAQARGNVIRGNRLENIPTNGVYCDNYTMGVLIENNVFKNVGNGGRFFAAAHMNGGGHNLIQKNILLF